MAAHLLSTTGKAAGSADVGDVIATQAIKPHLIHEAVTAEMAWRRAGTHSTKTRSDVSGGGAKPWRQKGTGRARAGSNRSPIWTGGGITFGPHPRSYGGKVNRKAHLQAFRSALRAPIPGRRLSSAIKSLRGGGYSARFIRANPTPCP